MSVAQIVAQHSSRYAQVIASLSEVEDAPIALQEHRDLVFDVELQLKESQANVQQLSKKTQKEKRAAESPREIFSPRKLAQTFLGKKDIFKAASLDSKRCDIISLLPDAGLNPSLPLCAVQRVYECPRG